MKIKRFGKCAVCGTETKLSEDHIPPKCCGNNKDTYYIQYTPDFLGSESVKKPVHSQNGLTFCNICDSCNNEMGTKYDIHLQKFRNRIVSIIENEKDEGSFEIKKVCKAIIGHFLAAASYDTSIFANRMRDYYLNDDESVFEQYSLLCAYYPYENSIFSLNDYVPVSICGDIIPQGMVSSLYFYPFAFILCEKQRPMVGSDLFEICRFVCVPLRICSLDWDNKSPIWPAGIDDGHAVIVSKAAENSKYKIK